MDSLPWSCVSTGARVAAAAGCRARLAGARSSSGGDAARIRARIARLCCRAARCAGVTHLGGIAASANETRVTIAACARTRSRIACDNARRLACPAVKVNNASTYDSYY